MKQERPDLLVGAVELGGTNCHCAVGSGPAEKLLSRVTFSSEVANPGELIKRVIEWFKQQEEKCGRLNAFGIASFGPIGLNATDYGYITNTPKKEWKFTDVVGPFRQAFGARPIGFNTDVNGAGFGEYWWGHAQGLDDFVYITMGTGVGGGGMSGGRLLGGMLHPEMGHCLLPRIDGDAFEGACDFHGRCWEGLCSGAAIKKRTGKVAEEVEDDQVWQQVAQYSSIALAQIILVLSPRKIIIGGSVRYAGKLGEKEFFKLIRAKVMENLKGYVDTDELKEPGIANYIVPPKLEGDAGICGGIALAQCAIASSST
jgi:fructokinase